MNATTLEAQAHRECATEARGEAETHRTRAHHAIDPADKLRHLEHAGRLDRIAGRWDAAADQLDADA